MFSELTQEYLMLCMILEIVFVFQAVKLVQLEFVGHTHS